MVSKYENLRNRKQVLSKRKNANHFFLCMGIDVGFYLKQFTIWNVFTSDQYCR